MNETDLLTFTAAAKLYGLSAPTIRRWVECEGLPCHRMPGTDRRRIARGDLVDFVSRMKVSAKAESSKTQ